jgi:hypothetical protein
MCKILFILIILIASCTPIRRATYRAEEEHYALYKQKALIVYDIKYNKVLLTNPSNTRYYFLKGHQYVKKWQAGDTMVIDSNLTDFYNLRFMK